MKLAKLFILLFLIIILAALIVVTFVSQRRREKFGGAPPKNKENIDTALYKYVRSLNVKHVLNRHPLAENKYTFGEKNGGAKHKKAISPKKLWYTYNTWEELYEDKDASDEYFKQRTMVLNNSDLDWSLVLADMNPKLQESHEYIGIIILDHDEKTLIIIASEASFVKDGDIKSETTFANISSDLVAKYASKPALFIFHTHPADIRGSPLPSSHDISTSVYFGATSRFAACAVISRYGVLVHGIDWSAYKAINEAKDWKLAVLNFSHDVVVAHESIRSWAMYKLSDYIDFYARHRLFMFTYPSAEMIEDMNNYSFIWDLESNIDYDIILNHIDDIIQHKKSISNTRTKTHIKKSVLNNSIKVTSIGFD